MKASLALLMGAYLVIFPADVMKSVQASLALWAEKVLPALFPFMALLPVLSGEEARRAYARLCGPALKRLFAIPGEGAACVGVGLLAGSPAGAIAVSRAADAGVLKPGQAFTCALLASGAGPVFLVSSVGSGMFSDASEGVRLLMCMWAALLATGLIASRLPERMVVKPVAPKLPDGQMRTPGALSDAVNGILTVGGWMALFSAFTCRLPQEIRAVSEISWGCAFAAANGNGHFAAFLAGFGGACACMQNFSCLRRIGIRGGAFFAMKLMSGAISAGLSYAPLKIPAISRLDIHAFPASSVCALAMALFIVTAGAFLWKKNNTLE